MVIKKKFWKNKKILITGHTGFKGSWLSLLLNELGSNLYGISLKPKKKSLFNILNINNLYKKNYFVDIRDYKEINKIIFKIKPQIIIHMAAQPLVSTSYVEPFNTYNININGTLNILETIRLKNLKLSILVVTTDKVYRPNINNIFRESSPLGGIDPYSSSKSCVEHIILSYSKLFKKNFVNVISARAGNVIGGGDWSKDRLIPDIVRCIFEKKKLTLRNMESIRPWQHVLEPLCGYLLSIQKNYKSNKEYEAINFGPGIKNEKKVKKIIEIVNNNYELTNYKIIKIAKFKEEKKLSLNNKLSLNILNWQNKLDLKHSINFTLNWYNQYYKNKKEIYKYTKNQILQYLKI